MKSNAQRKTIKHKNKINISFTYFEFESEIPLLGREERSKLNIIINGRAFVKTLTHLIHSNAHQGRYIQNKEKYTTYFEFNC